jgi:hypothetical protein
MCNLTPLLPIPSLPGYPALNSANRGFEAFNPLYEWFKKIYTNFDPFTETTSISQLKILGEF